MAMILLAANNWAIGEGLTTVQDKLLTSLITDSETLAQLESKASPYYVRIVRLRDHGECGPDLTLCPQETVYIAVSSYDEYPEQKVYILPKAYEWKFIRWHKIPKQEAPDEHITFVMKKKEVSNVHGKAQWLETQVEVLVNLEMASINSAARKKQIQK